MKRSDRTIQVTGDLVREHRIYRGSRPTPDAPGFGGTTESIVVSGAEQLYQILKHTCEAAAPEDDGHAVAACRGYDRGLLARIPTGLAGYSLWAPTPVEPMRKSAVWRQIQHLGYGPPEDRPNPFVTCDPCETAAVPTLLAVEDAGYGYRFKTAEKGWPQCLLADRNRMPAWILVNMGGPIARGDFWRSLSRKWQKKLVLVVSIEVIRNEETRISSRISWERSALDFLEELDNNPALGELHKCRHLIVNFGSAGAVHVDSSAAETRRRTLAFDPAGMEGEWRSERLGAVPGGQSCLAAAIAHQLTRKGNRPDILAGITSGLSAMRELYRKGHGPGDAPPGFPFKAVADEIVSPSHRYSSTQLPPPEAVRSEVRSSWSIIAGRAVKGKSSLRPLYGVARRVALLGPSALREIPYARFGKLFTTDRNEIESLRNIRQLVRQYQRTRGARKPLSLAVFGPPGSGKSFSIKQIAEDLPGEKPDTLEFNLSQFAGPADLVGAFHQVRDKVLSGRIPFVFWDEFDSANYRWLQYLLAPMQDGTFQEGQITHPIGKCIFVFAGGTSYTMDNFGPPPTDRTAIEDFRMKKGPDFISRLSGYLNVLGPNRRQLCHSGNCRPADNWVDDPTDICFPVRRALLIRVVLKAPDGDRLRIDSGLLTALLETDRYKHGARSLETILTQLKGDRRENIRRSNLPLEKSLSLHVDADDFLHLINRELRFMKLAAELAPAVHAAYRENAAKKKAYVKYKESFAQLPEDIQQDNIAAAARIPMVLGHVGLYVVPRRAQGSDTPSRAKISSLIEQNIELLAEIEHRMWMEEKLRNGWRFGKPRDDDGRIHPALVPYRELSEEDRQKDRNQVRKYLDFVERAGHKIATRTDRK